MPDPSERRRRIAPAPLMSGKEIMRLIFLLTALVVVLAMFFILPAKLRRTPQLPPAPQEEEQPPPERRGLPPQEQLSKPEKGFFQKPEDEVLAQVVDERPLEAAPYFYILYKVLNMSPTELSEKVDPSITPTDCMIEPAKYRGRFVRVEGTLKRFHLVDLANKNYGFDKVYEGTIASMGQPGEQFEFSTIVALEKPDQDLLNRNAAFEGIFLKKLVYENRAGNLTPSALFIGKVPVPALSRRMDWRPLFILFALCLFLVIGYFVISLMGGREAVRRRAADESGPQPEAPLSEEADREEMSTEVMEESTEGEAESSQETDEDERPSN